jgi:hypothetical protein
MRKIRLFLVTLRIGFAHATFHRNLKKAMRQKEAGNVRKFKRYIYRAEDAWKRVVILTEKRKVLNG